MLVFLFRSLLAAGLPVITAVFAVGSTLGAITLVSHYVGIASYTSPLMMLVGFGVGVDYSLLIFSRYRGEILAYHDRDTAARRALDTAGRSVLFAGTTVIIALLGLLALGLGGLRGVALAVALTVLMTMLASVTLLPALLSLFGKRLERGIRKHAAKRSKGSGPGTKLRTAPREHGNAWRRLADGVQRRPLAPLAIGLIVLIGLAIPAAGMRLGFADSGTDPAGSTTREAYDLMAEGFGPGFSGPLAVVTEDGDPVALQQRLASTPGIARALPPTGLTVLAFPTTSPQDEATAELVTRLRTEVLPSLPGHYLVGGSVAAATDFADAVADRLPLFVLVVVGLSALLLMVVFRSILIPLKAALLNLLSIGASLGVMTLVFGDGWFGAQSGPIEAFVPVMIFAIVFGLSMDYEVFLVSRMHEEWRRTGDACLAVREGLAATGGVITAMRRDHGAGVRRVPARPVPDAGAVRARPGGGGAAGRAADPLPARPGDHALARRAGLVAAARAGPAAPARRAGTVTQSRVATLAAKLRAGAHRSSGRASLLSTSTTASSFVCWCLVST